MAFGATLTLPTIAGSHSNFAVLLTNGSFPAAAIDGGASSIDNGGGNLRAYTDNTKTTQLALDVITFVTGVSPEIHVRVSVTAQTGATIYIESDSVETTQPAVGAAFGRNDTYTNEDLAHLLPDNAVVQVDSTGNDDGAIIGTGATTENTPPYGATNLDLNGTNHINSLTDPTTGSTHLAVRTWYKTSGGASKCISGSWLGGNTNSSYLFFTGSSNLALLRINNGSSASDAVSTTNVQDSTWHYIAGIYDGSNINIIVDGTNEDTTAKTGAIHTPVSAQYNIGRYNNSASTRPENIYDHRVSTNTNITLDYLATEYNNESDPDNWLTVGAWVDSGGGGISITVDSTLPSLSSSLNLSKVDNSFDIDVASILPSLSSSLSLSKTDNLFDISISSELPSLTSILNLSVVNPGNNASINSFLPSLSSSLSLTKSDPAAGVSISSELPSLISSLSLTVNNPAFDASVASVLPSLNSSLSLYNGILGISVGDRNNINIVVKSRNIDVITNSRNIEEY